jgi:hypothetical protein
MCLYAYSSNVRQLWLHKMRMITSKLLYLKVYKQQHVMHNFISSSMQPYDVKWLYNCTDNYIIVCDREMVSYTKLLTQC